MEKSYTTALGELVGNLHALEILLRAFLDNREKPSERIDYFKLAVGDMVPKSQLTKLNYLSELVDGYNKAVDENYALDTGVVTVRNLIAHGLVSAEDRNLESLVVLKFGKPNKNGMVEITHRETMNVEWLQRQKIFVREQL